MPSIKRRIFYLGLYLYTKNRLSSCTLSHIRIQNAPFLCWPLAVPYRCWGGISNHSWFNIQHIPRNMHTVFALLCFVVVIHWLIFPYPSGLLHWHCGNLTIAPVPATQPWWIWINTSCEFIMNDDITTTKQSTTKPCAYFLGYTVPLPIFGLGSAIVRWFSARLQHLQCVSNAYLIKLKAINKSI